MIEADAVLVLPDLSGLDAELRVVHDVVAVDAGRHEARRDVQAVGVQIRAVGIAQVRCRFVARGIGRQLVDHQDPQRVADVDAQRGRRECCRSSCAASPPCR